MDVGSGPAVVSALARLVARVARRAQRAWRKVAAPVEPTEALEFDARDLAISRCEVVPHFLLYMFLDRNRQRKSDSMFWVIPKVIDW